MSDEPKSANYWGALTTYNGPRWLLKHKPRFVAGPNGECYVEIHPEDAPLFEEGDDVEEER